MIVNGSHRWAELKQTFAKALRSRISHRSNEHTVTHMQNVMLNLLFIFCEKDAVVSHFSLYTLFINLKSISLGMFLIHRGQIVHNT